jgi:hypothetical protein
MSYGTLSLALESSRVGEKKRGWAWAVLIPLGKGVGVIVDGHAAQGGVYGRKQIELSRNRTYIENLEGLCPIH